MSDFVKCQQYLHIHVYTHAQKMCVSAQKGGSDYDIVDEQCKFMQTFIIQVTCFLAMWFSKYATLSIQTWRKKEISSYLVFI